MRLFVPVLILAAAAGVAFAAEGLKSGLQVDEFVEPFDVKDITGPNEGKSLCYR